MEKKWLLKQLVMMVLKLRWPLGGSKVQRLSFEDCCCAHYCRDDTVTKWWLFDPVLLFILRWSCSVITENEDRKMWTVKHVSWYKASVHLRVIFQSGSLTYFYIVFRSLAMILHATKQEVGGLLNIIVGLPQRPLHPLPGKAHICEGGHQNWAGRRLTSLLWAFLP